MSYREQTKSEKQQRRDEQRAQCEPVRQPRECYNSGNTPYDFSGATAAPSVGQFANPITPLNADETRAVVALVQASATYVQVNGGPAPGPDATENGNARFASVILQEPPKAYVLQWRPEQGTRRVAQALVYGVTQNRSWQFLVDMASLRIFRTDEVHVIPPLDTFARAVEDIPDVAVLLRSDARVVAALRKRGIDPNDLVSWGEALGQPNKYTWFDTQFEALIRACKQTQCAREILNPTDLDATHRIAPLGIVKSLPKYPDGSTVADPVESLLLATVDGLIILVDSTARAVVRVIDEFVQPLPTLVNDLYDASNPSVLISHARLNPIHACQPAGPSFRTEGNVITWDNWRMKYSWHPRAGVQLYQIEYNDAANPATPNYRSVMYKLSIDEAGVYYNTNEPLPNRSFVSNDSDTYPLLPRVRPLIPGLDTPPADSNMVRFFDIPLVATAGPGTTQDFGDFFRDGTVLTRNNAFAIYEQMGDLAFRGRNFVGCPSEPCLHFPHADAGNCSDLGTETQCNNAGTRDQQLCIRFYFSGIVYLWTFTYIFSRSGRIDLKIDVSGRVYYQTGVHQDTLWAQLISQNRLAFNHTHYWNVRADFDLDGTANSVLEENQYRDNSAPRADRCGRGRCSRPYSAAINYTGQTTRVEETVLATELTARRDHDAQRNRSWRVINPNRRNSAGHPVGYSLAALNDVNTSLAARYSFPHQHYQYLNHALHVTRYHDEEQYAGGNFPIMTCKDVGLGAYVADDEPLENQDVVVWYTALFAHSPHTEDHPYVTTEGLTLRFQPEDFFNINPNLYTSAPAYGQETWGPTLLQGCVRPPQ